jgi:hypothetical protein
MRRLVQRDGATRGFRLYRAWLCALVDCLAALKFQKHSGSVAAHHYASPRISRGFYPTSPLRSFKRCDYTSLILNTGAPRWKKCLPRQNWSTAGTVPSPFRRSRTGVRSARVQASSSSGRRSFTRKLLSQPTRNATPRYWFDSLATRSTSASRVLLREASPQPFLRTSFALARLPRASRLSIFSITVRYLLNETTSPRLEASTSVTPSFSSMLSSCS